MHTLLYVTWFFIFHVKGRSYDASTVTSSSFFSIEGDCQVYANCVHSMNYKADGSGKYGARDDCTVTMRKPTALTAEDSFEIEKGYDILKIVSRDTVDVRKKEDVPKTVSAGDFMRWKSDSSAQKGGWKICAGASADSDAPVKAAPTNCVFPIVLSGAKCGSRIQLHSGATTASECGARAMQNNACYKGDDARANFFFNKDKGNDCGCPTDRCSGQQMVAGYYLYAIVCGDPTSTWNAPTKDWKDTTYMDKGVGRCVKASADDSGSTKARYDQAKDVSQAECKLSCDFNPKCNGYSYNPSNTKGNCWTYEDPMSLTGGGSEDYPGWRCFLKTDFTPTKSRYMNNANGNINGIWSIPDEESTRAPVLDLPTDCEYPMVKSGAKCSGRKQLERGATTVSQCHALAMQNTACYRGDDSRAHFFFNRDKGTDCGCPTDNCKWQNGVAGYYLYASVCGNKDWMKNTYMDKGVGRCVRSNGDRATYDYSAGSTQAECKLRCDYDTTCNGYSFTPGATGYCWVYKDPNTLSGGGPQNIPGFRCFLKTDFTATPSRYVRDSSGNIVGTLPPSTAVETFSFEILSNNFIYGFAIIGVFAIVLKTYALYSKRSGFRSCTTYETII